MKAVTPPYVQTSSGSQVGSEFENSLCTMHNGHMECVLRSRDSAMELSLSGWVPPHIGGLPVTLLCQGQ